MTTNGLRWISLAGWLALLGAGFCSAQEARSLQRQLTLHAKHVSDTQPLLRLLPSEEEQELGNAVPVLLRIIHEQYSFLQKDRPKLSEYAGLEYTDSRIADFPFQSFAKQIIRAGSMSTADWQYPIRSDRPNEILLPDAQSQRDFVGRGMTIWVKQQLAAGDISQALTGIRAQLACSRHISATPILICSMVGRAISDEAFDNLELVMQQPTAPNLYWSLAVLPDTLVDLSPAIRWELGASPARLKEPLPTIGDPNWQKLASKFIEEFAAQTVERYTMEEAGQVKENMDKLATDLLRCDLGFTAEQMQQTTVEERIMRWIAWQHSRISVRIEAMAHESLTRIIELDRELAKINRNILEQTKAKSSPFRVEIGQRVLSIHLFGRTVRFLQTIEAVRAYASKHNAELPGELSQLELHAPNDPFTDAPFYYKREGRTATLGQAEISGFQAREYILSFH